MEWTKFIDTSGNCYYNYLSAHFPLGRGVRGGCVLGFWGYYFFAISILHKPWSVLESQTVGSTSGFGSYFFRQTYAAQPNYSN